MLRQQQLALNSVQFRLIAMLLTCTDVSQSAGQIFKRLIRTPCAEAHASKQAEVAGKKNLHSGSGERVEPFARQCEALRRVTEFRERKTAENSCDGVRKLK